MGVIDMNDGAEGAGSNIEKEQGGAEGGTKETPKEQASDPKLVAKLQALEAQNAQMQEGLERSSRESAAAQSYVQQLVASLTAAAARGDERAEERLQTLKDRFEQNPQAVLDEHFQARVAPLAETYARNQAELNRQLAISKITQDPTNKTIFDKYAKEVDDFMANMPGEVRVQPGAYERAFRFIQAEHLDDVIEMRTKAASEKEKQAFLEPPSGGAARPKGPAPLSDVEKQVAKGLGLSEDEYAKWREAS